MTTVKVKGMSCGHCTGAVQKALEAIPGISDVEVDLDKAEARFEGTVDGEMVKEAITKIGFEVV